MNKTSPWLSGITRLKKQYWPLIKSRQTFMLALTGIAGYLSQRSNSMDWFRLTGVAGSLLVTIAGCTVLNMVFDLDIDRKMTRTSKRPLAAGQVNVRSVTYLGAILLGLGLLWAVSISAIYFLLILAGACLDVLVYTIWLKRRSAWSILWGGLSGGLPILAGRTLALGRVDIIGVLLALAVVFWIPSHNLTLGMLYMDDYLAAGIPTFMNTYGMSAGRAAVATSSLLAVSCMIFGFELLRFPLPLMVTLFITSLALVGFAFYSLVRASRKAVATLYKYSSIYMLATMLLLLFASLIRL